MKKQIAKSQIVIYKNEFGETKIDVRFDGDTVWLTQNALADLLKTIVKKFFIVQKEGD